MYIYFNKELVATFIVLFLPTTKKMIFEGRYSYKKDYLYKRHDNGML